MQLGDCAMKRNVTGQYIPVSTVGEMVKAFIPAPLPPNPPLSFDSLLQEVSNKAHIALGRLDSAAAFLPETPLFLYQYIRKEAVLSSQIEGTQSSLSDLMMFEAEGMPGVPLDDVREVVHYVAALEHGIKRLKEGFPFSLRLVREMHGVLLKEGRGREKTPGDFRRSQNWIGGTRPGEAIFVPPPADQIINLMGEWEYFLQGMRGKFNPLVKAALAHAQFETIHPFLDGNGRLGRLLITLLLVHEKVLTEPLLYLSLYFKTHRQEYYSHLQEIRTDGDWESWLKFFFEAVWITADQGVSTAQRLHSLARKDRERIESLGRIAGSALRVHHVLLSRPVASVGLLCKETGLVPNTVSKILKALIKQNIVEEVTGRSRNRLYVYRHCLEIMNEGTEAIH